MRVRERLRNLFKFPLSIEDELLIAHHELSVNPSITSYTIDDGEARHA